MKSNPPPCNFIGLYDYPVMDVESVHTSLTKYDRGKPSYHKPTWALAWHFVRLTLSEQLRGSHFEKFTLSMAIEEFDVTKAAGWPWSICCANKGQVFDHPDFVSTFTRFYNSKIGRASCRERV